MSNVFADFDIEKFWEPSEYALESYIDKPLTSEIVATIEHELGYRLPASYVEFMQFQNGGIPWRTNHRTAERTSWAPNHIAITGISAIGDGKPYSLLGGLGGQFWIDQWNYPSIGIYFANCPSAGHDMLCLDYQECGPAGEPRVVHVDQEWDYRVVYVAENFEAFIRGLEDDTAFEADLD